MEENRNDQPEMEEQSEKTDQSEKAEQTDQADPNEDFAAQVEKHMLDSSQIELEVGQRVRGTIVQIGEKESFIDFGGRSEGTILSVELRDENEEIKFAVGDPIEATVESAEEQVVFTLGKKSARIDKETLRLNYEGKVPVEGEVKSSNKGGFEVIVSGLRAFCPFSQIDIAYCSDPEYFIGQKLSFLITRFDGGGRNIILSRRALLEEERKDLARETEERLKEGEVFEGIVCRVLPFGAFVDIGGVEGLLHVSEVSHTHIKDPSTVLSPGKKIQVQVVKVDQGDKGRRISLSMKALEPDPWDAAASELKTGTVVTGKVARLADFGAFIALAPGVDGLLHISEISTERINHPKDVLKTDQEIEVKILEIDQKKKRISLSRRALDKDTGKREEKTRLTEYQTRPRKEEKKQKQAPEPSVSNESMDSLLSKLQDKFKDDTLG